MNDALRDFKIWFQGFRDACTEELTIQQWNTLAGHIEGLPVSENATEDSSRIEFAEQWRKDRARVPHFADGDGV